MKPSPPKRALQFLRWFCREDYIEEIEGDLTEIFERQYAASPRKARLRFIWNVIRYFRPEFIKALRLFYPVNPLIMIRHNLLIAYRNFLRYKGSFLINASRGIMYADEPREAALALREAINAGRRSVAYRPPADPAAED
ncbi:MAG: permease prefix domain 2-containing transporter, partial [Cyclobacteriaceae bacterium]|nr:permease prefix domain 2-containing transporter [Cyclobacteriaceae bacterium]